MMGLSGGDRISLIRSAVLIQYTRVTDGQTDGRTHRQTDGIGVAYTRYNISAVARKNYFTDRLSRKFAMQRYVDIPPHLTYVATLPCET